MSDRRSWSFTVSNATYEEIKITTRAWNHEHHQYLTLVHNPSGRSRVNYEFIIIIIITTNQTELNELKQRN